MSDRPIASRRIRQLDLSGGPGSWFDLWHMHLSEQAVNDPYRATKRDDIVELLNAYDELNEAVRVLDKPYQIFILIDSHSYRESAVYLHTENPNGTTFPINFKKELVATLDAALQAPLLERGMNMLTVMTDDGPLHYAFDPSIGIPIQVEN